MPDFAGAFPSWLKDVSVVGLIVFFGFGLTRGWFYTSGQVEKLLAQYEKVSSLWEKVAEERQETIKLLSDNTEPILKGNEAILRAVEQLQQARGDAPRTRPERERRQ